MIGVLSDRALCARPWPGLRWALAQRKHEFIYARQAACAFGSVVNHNGVRIMPILAEYVIPVFMQSAERREDVLQFLRDMPIPDSDKESAYRWYAQRVGLAVTDDDLRGLGLL